MEHGASGEYCTDIIARFTLVKTLEQMPLNELCHPCYVGRLRLMQASPYSIFCKLDAIPAQRSSASTASVV